MVRMMIRVDGALSSDLTNAFPHLTSRHHRPSTTLVGELSDQEELQGVLNMLRLMGVDLLEVLTIPDD
jgi:hypothetical protein